MSSSYYLKSGNTFRVSSKEAMDLHEKLPPTNYVVKVDMHGNFYLEAIGEFKMPKKLYGNVNIHTKRILHTFKDRIESTGVLLCGEKGSGKSLLAKNISIVAGNAGVPTLIINTPFNGDGFNSFIQSITQPCIVLFDEFEKVYDQEQQEAILTLLDGVYPSKKLFILTSNDKWRVDQHMRNRPGRIYYLINYDGLDAAFIEEFCHDNLNDKSQIDKIVQVATSFDKFNFDMLKAIIEEMNRFNESVVDSLRVLNAKPEFSGEQNYNVKLIIDNVEIEEDDLDDKTFRGNPLVNAFRLDYWFNDRRKNNRNTPPTRGELVATKAFVNTLEQHAGFDSPEVDEDNRQYRAAIFNPNDLKSIEDKGMKHIFVNDKREMVILTKIVYKSYDYLDSL